MAESTAEAASTDAPQAAAELGAADLAAEMVAGGDEGAADAASAAAPAQELVCKAAHACFLALLTRAAQSTGTSWGERVDRAQGGQPVRP